jgi:DnaJ-domain-containing protein 1
MIWLSNSTLARLRDQLLETGGRPSMVGTSVEALAPQLQAEYAPLCEAMYLMMAADGEVSGEERDVLKGALRNLSGSSLRTADIEALLAQAVGKVEAEGRDARLRAVAAVLSEDRAKAEVAFVLAAAIAFADNAIADDENETLSSLAEAIGIDESRAEALLDEVERDLAAESRES